MSPQKKRPKKKSPVVSRDVSDVNAPEDVDDVHTGNGSRASPHDDAWDDLKRLTRQQLEFAGWIDEVEAQCRLIAADTAGDAGSGRAVRHEQLLDGVREPMLRRVPDHIKARVLKDIKDKLLASSADDPTTGAE